MDAQGAKFPFSCEFESGKKTFVLRNIVGSLADDPGMSLDNRSILAAKDNTIGTRTRVAPRRAVNFYRNDFFRSWCSSATAEKLALNEVKGLTLK